MMLRTLSKQKTIFFLESDYHCYLNKERKWYCETCPGVCKQKHRFQPILTTLDQPIERESEIKYSTISTLPIPVSLDESMTQVYTRQLSRGLELPLNILPEAEYCVNGYPFNKLEDLVLEKTGIIIYTENEAQ